LNEWHILRFSRQNAGKTIAITFFTARPWWDDLCVFLQKTYAVENIVVRKRARTPLKGDSHARYAGIEGGFLALFWVILKRGGRALSSAGVGLHDSS
jgi:hypothetical protein